MFNIKCLFMIAILGTVRSQTYSIGGCNDRIPTPEDFSPFQVYGKWFVFQRSFNIRALGTRCNTFTFQALYEHVFNMTSSFHLPFLSRQTHDFQIYAADPDSALQGKLIAKPGLVSASMPVWFLDIDYERFAVIYSCQTLGNFMKREMTWILSRNVQLDDAGIAQAEAVLMDRNINLKLRLIKQICDDK